MSVLQSTIHNTYNLYVVYYYSSTYLYSSIKQTHMITILTQVLN